MIIDEIKDRAFTLYALLLAVAYWLVEIGVHRFLWHEPDFKLVPEDPDELWMRGLVVLLIVTNGAVIDYFSARLAKTRHELKAQEVYGSMLQASYHILNNLLNQMQMFRLEAEESGDFDSKVLASYDTCVAEASHLLQSLSEVEHLNADNIWASVNPDNPENRSRQAE
jgi:hypothetical protein